MAESDAAARVAAEAARAKRAVVSSAQKAGSSDLGQKATQLAHQTANTTKKYAVEAKAKGAAAAKATRDAIRKKALEMATVAATKIVNKAVDSVSVSMGRDPYMPEPVLRAVDSVLDDIKGDAEIMLRENLEALIAGTDKAAVAKITATYRPCCSPNPLSWLRALLLYTMTPNDRSIWWQLRQPAWWLFTAVSVFPLYGVAQVWWVLLFFLRDFRDEFQLVSFMIKVKTAAVISVGLLPSYIGISTYISCTERGTCNTEGPGVGGSAGTFMFQTVFLCVQAALVYLAALLIPCSKDKGRARVKRTAATQMTTQAGDERGQRRLLCWIIYDLLTCVLVAALFFMSWLAYRDGNKSTGVFREEFTGKHAGKAGSAAAAAAANATTAPAASELSALNTTALDYADKLDDAVVVANALFMARVYWLRVLYGLLCVPWWLLKLPLMSSLLLHTHPTAYNRRGETVPFATAKEKEKEGYGHRCFKCSEDESSGDAARGANGLDLEDGNGGAVQMTNPAHPHLR
jgi:hypothetical protein